MAPVASMKDYYVTAAVFGLALSSIGVGFALLSGITFALTIGACLVTLHIWSYYYASVKVRQERPNAAMAALVSPLFIVLFGGSVGSMVISAPLALLPAIAVLLTISALVIRHVRGRGHADGEDLSKTQLHAGEWVTLLAGSALAGYLGLFLYRQIYA